MRQLFRSLAILDILSLIFVAMELLQIAVQFSETPSDNFLAQLKSWLMFPMFWLILIGSYGLFFQKKFGYILYYIQFPAKVFLPIFTIGFITLIPEALSYYGDFWFSALMKICIVTEIARLFLTISSQLKMRDLVWNDNPNGIGQN